MTEKSKIIENAEKNVPFIGQSFIEEVTWLCNSGAVGEDTPQSAIFVVALENIAAGIRSRDQTASKEITNLRKF